VNNTSVHEISPNPNTLLFSQQGAIENLTKTLALEYAASGIRVNSVGPGAVVTPSTERGLAIRRPSGGGKPYTDGRAAEASEMASVFAFLASDEAAYITGQTIFACGGLTLFAEFRTTWSS